MIIGGGSIWDIVAGVIKNPAEGLTAAQMKKSTDTGKRAIIWRRDNSFAILTIKRNCEPEVIDTIRLTRSAHEAYTELKLSTKRKW